MIELMETQLNACVFFVEVSHDHSTTMDHSAADEKRMLPKPNDLLVNLPRKSYSLYMPIKIRAWRMTPKTAFVSHVVRSAP